MSRRFLLVADVAELFRRHRSTVYRAVADGRLPPPRRGAVAPGGLVVKGS